MTSLLLFLLAAAANPSATEVQSARPPEKCAPLSGVEIIRDRQRPTFVVMGETHGTAELPAAFADLVCAYAKTGEPLTVGLEFLPAEQPAIDAYLASGGGADAKAAILASPAWAIRDGRASQAIFDLIEMLRRIKHEHPDLAVVAFDHPSEKPGTSAAREKAMAEILLSARHARPKAPVLALTGMGHAGKIEWTSMGPPFPAMSQHLPADSTLALAFDVAGGERWACRRLAEGAPQECGPRPVTTRATPVTRGLYAGSSRKGYDATVSVGTELSASPPARPGA